MGKILEVLNRICIDDSVSVSVRPDKSGNLVGQVQMGNEHLDLKLHNFQSGFAVQQSIRDMQGANLPMELTEYKDDPTKNISISLGDDNVELTDAFMPEFDMLLIAARSYTDSFY